jgi:hypothetical protein
MKKQLLFIFIFCPLFSFSQNPLIKQWDYRYGGTDDDFISLLCQVNDGGYLLSGFSNSGISGDKTQSAWGINDYWIIKTNSSGILQWDKTYGGINNEQLNTAAQTKDGGYIFGGYSASGISGDVSQQPFGYNDYWVIKTDSLGNKQWDKRFGGTVTNQLTALKQTNDHGYILGGWSDSGIGGCKTQAGWGFGDYWIVKIDSLGNQQWDKRFGGTANDRLTCLQITSDGGYLLGGWSASGISGDKTGPLWGGAWTDFWIVKTDSLGNKQWDKDFGGTNQDFLSALRQTNDGGYILLGYSNSPMSGDKTQAAFGQNDYWLLKIDSTGTKQWDKDYGGTDSEDATSNIEQTFDGGYLLSGTSYSPISGTKSENNLGTEQVWVVKTDLNGVLQWEKTILTNGHDEGGFAIQSHDGCYVMANYGNAGTGGYRTQNNRGSSDYWIVKFCDTTAIPVSIFTSVSPLCPGTCTDFINLSQNASGFQWSFPGGSPSVSTDVSPTNICYSTPGSYDVQLIATNANESDTLLLSNYITIYPYPPPQGISQSGDTLFAIAGSSSYQWYFNGSAINGATDYFYSAQASGDYNVVATDTNGCEVEAAIFNVVANILPTVDHGQLTVFPNPVRGKLAIGSMQLAISSVSIYNSMGERVTAASLQTADCILPTCSLDVSQLPPGLYYLVITAGEKTFHSKFVKE